MLNVRKIKIFGITFFDANYKEIKKLNKYQKRKKVKNNHENKYDRY